MWFFATYFLLHHYSSGSSNLNRFNVLFFWLNASLYFFKVKLINAVHFLKCHCVNVQTTTLMRMYGRSCGPLRFVNLKLLIIIGLLKEIHFNLQDAQGCQFIFSTGSICP